MMPISTTKPAWTPSAGVVVLMVFLGVVIAGASAPTGMVTLSLQDAEFPAPQFTIETPTTGTTFSPEQAITFRATYDEAAGTHEMQLYVKRGSEPGTDDLVDSRNVGAGHAYEFTYVPSPAWGAGRYYWKLVAVNEDASTAESSTYTYVVHAPATAASDETSGSHSSSTAGVCPGGPGGHVSDAIGEKAFMSFTLDEGKTTVLRFHKGNVHGIEKIVLFAVKPLYSNALIIHQEFEDETGYTLPPVEAVYKTIHVHQTHVWKNENFYAAVFYRVPKYWLYEKGKKVENVHVQAYENKAWSPVPSFLVGDEEEYYVFQSTLRGLPPFAIGACSKVVEGRVLQAIISGTA